MNDVSFSKPSLLVRGDADFGRPVWRERPQHQERDRRDQPHDQPPAERDRERQVSGECRVVTEPLLMQFIVRHWSP